MYFQYDINVQIIDFFCPLCPQTEKVGKVGEIIFGHFYANLDFKLKQFRFFFLFSQMDELQMSVLNLSHVSQMEGKDRMWYVQILFIQHKEKHIFVISGHAKTAISKLKREK